MTLEQRLEKLESENRWARKTVAVAVAAAVAVFVIGQAAVLLIGQARGMPDLEARSLKIKDEDGNVRIALGMRERDLGPYLDMKDKRGKDRIGLGLLDVRNIVKGSPFLGLSDGRGTCRMLLQLTDGMPSLQLLDDDINALATLELVADEAAGARGFLTFHDKEAKGIWKAPKD